MTDKLIAKVTRQGVVWTSYYIGPGKLAYKMERVGSTRSDYSLIDEIEVRPSPKGWQVWLYGDPVATGIRYKSDAQRQAESLLDNSLDSFGYPLQTAGRI